MKITDCNGNCNVEQPPICHWETGKAGARDEAESGYFAKRVVAPVKEQGRSVNTVRTRMLF